MRSVVACVLFLIVAPGISSALQSEFPKDFLFGAATSAYQVEGGWDADGKGPNVWDTAIHSNPHMAIDGSNGDISCDSYHLFDKDLEVIKQLGLSFYRFSISWSRILPNGDISSLNQAGVDFYNRVIDKLKANNIEPMVTMFHSDLPEEIQKIGGAASPLFVEYFASYANVLYKLFGNRVRYWSTINQPRLFCIHSYGIGSMAPNINASGVGDYLCGDHALKAHTKAYQIYKQDYFRKYGGRVGIVLDANVTYQQSGNETKLDERAMQYYFGWFAHPLLGEDYPHIMRKEIGENSKREGRAWSRLPKLSVSWIKSMKGSCDFIGLNYYSARYGRPMGEPYNLLQPSFDQDVGLQSYPDPSWPAANAWLLSYPKGLRDILKWIKDRYGDVEVIITENGWADCGQLNDTARIDYLKQHLQEVLNAIYIDKCNVTGYAHWSLLDNFEWLSGYTEKFGLYSVDFSSTGRKRTAKNSAIVYKDIIKTRKL